MTDTEYWIDNGPLLNCLHWDPTTLMCSDRLVGMK